MLLFIFKLGSRRMLQKFARTKVSVFIIPQSGNSLRFIENELLFFSFYFYFLGEATLG